MANNDEYQQKRHWSDVRGLEDQIMASESAKLKKLTLEDFIEFLKILELKENDKRKDNK